MRIWDIQPKRLCRFHLLGEHRELHALWAILTKNKSGYRKHPETKRWEGKLKALYLRHKKLVEEMRRRGYRHHSYLDAGLARGKAIQDSFLQSMKQQEDILKKKPCPCFAGGSE